MRLAGEMCADDITGEICAPKGAAIAGADAIWHDADATCGKRETSTRRTGPLDLTLVHHERSGGAYPMPGFKLVFSFFMCWQNESSARF